MESPEASQMCWFCKKRPATAQYTHRTARIDEMVCAICLDRLEVQEAYEHESAYVIHPLEINDRYDEALAHAEAFLAANRHRDHDQWLARSVAMDRAHILFDAGRYAEAEQACKTWADLGFADVGQRWMQGALTAEVLDALGRSQEGLAVLEDALSYQDPREIPGAWGYLMRLATISEKLGQPVDPKWRSLAKASAAWYGVELPEHASLNKVLSELLPNAIDKAARTRRGEPEESDDDDDES